MNNQQNLDTESEDDKMVIDINDFKNMEKASGLNINIKNASNVPVAKHVPNVYLESTSRARSKLNFDANVDKHNVLAEENDSYNKFNAIFNKQFDKKLAKDFNIDASKKESQKSAANKLFKVYKNDINESKKNLKITDSNVENSDLSIFQDKKEAPKKKSEKKPAPAGSTLAMFQDFIKDRPDEVNNKIIKNHEKNIEKFKNQAPKKEKEKKENKENKENKKNQPKYQDIITMENNYDIMIQDFKFKNTAVSLSSENSDTNILLFEPKSDSQKFLYALKLLLRDDGLDYETQAVWPNDITRGIIQPREAYKNWYDAYNNIYQLAQSGAIPCVKLETNSLNIKSLFATKKIPKDTILAEFVGSASTTNPHVSSAKIMANTRMLYKEQYKEDKKRIYISVSKCANWTYFLNFAPYTDTINNSINIRTVVTGLINGVPKVLFLTSADIEPDQELVVGYVPDIWPKVKNINPAPSRDLIQQFEKYGFASYLPAEGMNLYTAQTSIKEALATRVKQEIKYPVVKKYVVDSIVKETLQNINPIEAQEIRIMTWLNYYGCYPDIEVKPSPGKGLGVFATGDIFENCIIGEYCGEVLYEKSMTQEQSNDDGNMRYNILVERKLVGGKLMEDELVSNVNKFGCWTYFVNSIMPGDNKNLTNCEYIDSGVIDNLPRIILKTTRPIEKGEELIADYGKDYWNKNNIKKPEQNKKIKEPKQAKQAEVKQVKFSNPIFKVIRSEEPIIQQPIQNIQQVKQPEVINLIDDNDMDVEMININKFSNKKPILNSIESKNISNDDIRDQLNNMNLINDSYLNYLDNYIINNFNRVDITALVDKFNNPTTLGIISAANEDRVYSANILTASSENSEPDILPLSTLSYDFLNAHNIINKTTASKKLIEQILLDIESTVENVGGGLIDDAYILPPIKATADASDYKIIKLTAGTHMPVGTVIGLLGGSLTRYSTQLQQPFISINNNENIVISTEKYANFGAFIRQAKYNKTTYELEERPNLTFVFTYAVSIYTRFPFKVAIVVLNDLNTYDELIIDWGLKYREHESKYIRAKADILAEKKQDVINKILEAKPVPVLKSKNKGIIQQAPIENKPQTNLVQGFEKIAGLEDVDMNVDTSNMNPFDKRREEFKKKGALTFLVKDPDVFLSKKRITSDKTSKKSNKSNNSNQSKININEINKKSSIFDIEDQDIENINSLVNDNGFVENIMADVGQKEKEIIKDAEDMGSIAFVLENFSLLANECKTFVRACFNKACEAFGVKNPDMNTDFLPAQKQLQNPSMWVKPHFLLTGKIAEYFDSIKKMEKKKIYAPIFIYLKTINIDEFQKIPNFEKFFMTREEVSAGIFYRAIALQDFSPNTILGEFVGTVHHTSSNLDTSFTYNYVKADDYNIIANNKRNLISFIKKAINPVDANCSIIKCAKKHINNKTEYLLIHILIATNKFVKAGEDLLFK